MRIEELLYKANDAPGAANRDRIERTYMPISLPVEWLQKYVGAYVCRRGMTDLGAYRIHRWGKPAERVMVQRKSGDLYLNEIRLITELEPGLYLHFRW